MANARTVYAEWCPTHVFHQDVNVFFATASAKTPFGLLQRVSLDEDGWASGTGRRTSRRGKLRIPQDTTRLVWYVCTDYEKGDDDVAISGCQVGSSLVNLVHAPRGGALARVSAPPLCCDVTCKTTTTQFLQGVIKMHGSEFERDDGASRAQAVGARNASGQRLDCFNEFVSKELCCFGLQPYCKYDVPLMCVVDQTSCEPVGTVDHMHETIDDEGMPSTVFSVVGHDGARTLEEWNQKLNKQLGLYKHPVVFEPGVPIASRVHLTEWTPLNRSLPAALFFSQFEDAAELREPHLLATLEIALRRNDMTADEFVEAVAKQREESGADRGGGGVLRAFNKAVTVCAESATVLPNAFEYRTDATRDEAGKLVMMDKMERLNGWVRRSYGDCEDMAAYMTQHLHTLRETETFTHPLAVAAHQLMREYLPLAVLGSVTYEGSGGAKLADSEYKHTKDMYKDGNAAHMWTMLVPHADVMHMLGEDTSGYDRWQKQLRLRVCEGTSRMSPNISCTRATQPSIRSLRAQHARSDAYETSMVLGALRKSGVRHVQRTAHTELHPDSGGHPFYKRVVHVFTPSLQTHPGYENWIQYVFCEESEHDTLYSLPLGDILQKRGNCKLRPVPVCGRTAKELCRETMRDMPKSEAMSAAGNKTDTVTLSAAPPHTQRISEDASTHRVWVRGDARDRGELVLRNVRESFADKHAVLESCCESIGVDAPTMTCFKITLRDCI